MTDRWYQQIGQLKVEVDWLKKKLVLTLEEKRAVVEPRHPQILLRRPCELPGLSRSSRYVVAWELSITLEPDFWVTTLQRALTLGRPEVFNTDQGSQSTSDGGIETLKDA